MAKFQKGTFVMVPNKHVLKGLPSYVQSVFMWLNSFSDGDGLCFPSRTTLAESAGCSVRSVDNALETLTNLGLIEIRSRKNPQNPKQNLTSVYQIMTLENGGVVQEVHQGSASGAPGVVQEVQRELNPLLTQPIKKGENKFSVSSEEIVEVRDDEKPRAKKDSLVMKLREKLYDTFEQSKGVRPIPHLADYITLQTALKHLTREQVETLVEDELAAGNPITVRECLTNRKITKFLQENY